MSGPDAQANNAFRAWIDDNKGPVRGVPSAPTGSETLRRLIGNRQPATPTRRATDAERPKRHVPKIIWIPAVCIVIALVGLLLTQHRGNGSSVTASTPAADLPWRLQFSSINRFAVELPGASKQFITYAPDGTGGEAISCAIPGLKIEIGGYPYHAGINQTTAINEFFDARANALSARLTTQQATSVHWGPAIQAYLANSTGRIGILIGGFVGTTMYIFQLMGPVDDPRTTDVLAHLMATFAPAG